MRSEYDVAVVGYGPVGQLAAILLGRMGHSVAVLERWPELYPRPRAVHYDDEIARVFQRIGIAERLAPITEPATTYEWKNAGDQTLLTLDRSEPGRSGWPAATMFTQPQLEAVLDETARALSTVEVHQGWELTDLHDEGEQVRLSVRRGAGDGVSWAPTGERQELSAGWVIGCDGANSLVRERMGTPVEDLGFVFDWLIADTVPHDPGLLAGVNLQRCDPTRPTTLVSGGPGRRRWEWMLLPGETREQVENAEFVWSMLAASGISAADVELERFIVYTFRARWAERWREGRLLLAGDAAHLMPPFAGQGMCSGIRDAFTLAWHLDLVLKGLADESTLDAYTSERRGHLQHAIAVSVELGKVICISDEAEAAARDEVLLAVAADPDMPAIEPPVPNLGPGLHEGVAADQPGAAGSLFPQALVQTATGRMLLEDTLPGGFVLYALDVEPRTLLGADSAALLEQLGTAFVAVTSELDSEGAYRDWFESNGATAALVRPDFYVFGTATTAAETDELVRRLADALKSKANDEETRS
jgi:2-polyprenyl-6-methoxyphenol hydroxylase-like FAD-dependent oxidoreductase